MAKILPFAQSRAGRRSTARKPDGKGGEVVIFTGVRVEYHDQRRAAQPGGQGRRQSSGDDALSA